MNNKLKANSDFLSRINTTLILKTIWEHSSISRTDIVDRTNLTAATLIFERFLKFSKLKFTKYVF